MISLLFYSIVLVSLITAFGVYFIFWYETLNSPCGELKQPPFTISRALRLYVLFILAFLVRLCLVPTSYFIHRKKEHSPLAPEEHLSHPPIVLVHGLFDRPSSWLYITRKLEREGYRVIPYGYNSFSMDIPTIVKKFNDELYIAEASFPHAKPILIGHSLGGIVIREWLRTTSESTTRTCGVITLGTPHSGSRLAIFTRKKAGIALRPNSDLLDTLNAAKSSDAIPYVALVTPTDEMVLPASSLLPPKGWKLRITRETTHVGMLFCPEVYGIIREELFLMETPHMQPMTEEKQESQTNTPDTHLP